MVVSGNKGRTAILLANKEYQYTLNTLESGSLLQANPHRPPAGGTLSPTLLKLSLPGGSEHAPVTGNDQRQLFFHFPELEAIIAPRLCSGQL